MQSTKVIFQADERLFVRDRNAVELTMKLEPLGSAAMAATAAAATAAATATQPPGPSAWRFATKTFLSVLYSAVARAGAKHGVHTPQSVFALMSEYLVVRCLSIGTPVQVLDLLADTVSWRPRERLLVMRKMCSILVTLLPGQRPTVIKCDARQSGRAVVRQTLRAVFGEQGETFFDATNYELCLATVTTAASTEPTALDWAGLGAQVPPFAPLATNSWCWLDDQYNFLYEIDVSVWRTVWLRKRFFFSPNAVYLSAVNNHTNDPLAFDLYQDLAECRQTILRIVRDYSTDERSLDHAIRRLVASIASETALLSTCPTNCPNRGDEYCRSHTVSAPARDLDKHVKIRTLFDTLTLHLKSVRVTAVAPSDADDDSDDSTTTTTTTTCSPLHFSISPEARTYAKHLFDARLSCFRCLPLVRIGHETLLPLALMNGRLLFTRVESQTRGGGGAGGADTRSATRSRVSCTVRANTIDKALFTATAAGSYHVKNMLQKSRVVPHQQGAGPSACASATAVASVCSPVPRRRLATSNTSTSTEPPPLTICIRLKDYVCWRRDNATQSASAAGLFRRRLGVMGGSYRGTSGARAGGKSGSDTFRYFSINVRNCTADSIRHLLTNYSSLYALNTMTVGDMSAAVLMLHGHGVRSVLTMIRAVHCVAAATATGARDTRVHGSAVPDNARQSLRLAMRELRSSFNPTGAATATAPPRNTVTAADIADRVRRTVDRNYANMKYIDTYMQQNIGEGLPMFGVLETLYQQREIEGNLERILDVMQNIYKHLPYLLNQLLFMQKYEVHDAVVKLL